MGNPGNEDDKPFKDGVRPSEVCGTCGRRRGRHFDARCSNKKGETRMFVRKQDEPVAPFTLSPAHKHMLEQMMNEIKPTKEVVEQIMGISPDLVSIGSTNFVAPVGREPEGGWPRMFQNEWPGDPDALPSPHGPPPVVVKRSGSKSPATVKVTFSREKEIRFDYSEVAFSRIRRLPPDPKEPTAVGHKIVEKPKLQLWPTWREKFPVHHVGSSYGQPAPYTRHPALPGLHVYLRIAMRDANISSPADLITNRKDLDGPYRWCTRCKEVVGRSRLDFKHGPQCDLAPFLGLPQRPR